MMMLPDQWEAVVAERRRDWEKESELQRMLAQIPRNPSPWRQWTGQIMVWAGTVLMRLGERLAARKCQESASTVG
jgi:hypothetical protein